mmetsp:Transcript_53105/g.95264  ORF Transcript_53105/g.95264 Transcript_53105/m.95264 type:complete len:275 (+) Transcript_53105:34-858(+)
MQAPQAAVQSFGYPSVKFRGSTPVTWGHFRALLQLLHEVFGPQYAFAPLHRCEGGINCLRWPGGISTEPEEGDMDRSSPPCRKAIRFELDLYGCWPSSECKIHSTVTDAWIIFNKHADVTQISAEGQGCAAWTEDEIGRFGACISKAFSWDILKSPGSRKALQIAAQRGWNQRGVSQSFAEWVESLCVQGNYHYDAAPEVADFLTDFAEDAADVVDAGCRTWPAFRRNYLLKIGFKSWPTPVKRAAAHTYHEWKFGPGGRLKSPKYGRPVARPY